jgi:zinc transport system ATP-binding protein
MAHPAGKPLIEVSQISHQFGQNRVLDHVSLVIHPKEIVTLIGPNGAGKSTLLKILLGLLKPTSGKVVRKTGLNIGFMPQKIHIDPTLPLTVERFLTLGIPKTRRKNHVHNTAQSTLKNPADNHTTTVAQVIDELNIGHLLNQPIQRVSGGEMQRILLARALVREPDLLVLDEPVQGVDIQGQTELYQYINQIRHQRGVGILMVSHDLHIVMKNTDQVLCLNQHICCSGHPQDVSQSSEFKALFGGQTDIMAFYEHHHDHSHCDHAHGHAPLINHANHPPSVKSAAFTRLQQTEVL